MQTHFELKQGTGQGGNSIGPFNHGTMTGFAFGTSHGQDSSGVTGVGATQMCRLAAHPSPMTILENGCVDPFFKPPARLNEQGCEAIDHSKCHTEHVH